MKRVERRPDAQGIFEGLDGAGKVIQRYPAWRYHRLLDPVLVNDTSEDEEVRGRGYDDPLAPISANKQFSNWYWDLEDMSRKQLAVFAREEFGVDLPAEASQAALLKAVVELSRWAPDNRGRIVLMAHTIRMNYEETLDEIRKAARGGMQDVETKEVVL